jgi:heterodisulfide reductase subunit C
VQLNEVRPAGTITPSSGLAREIRAVAGTNVNMCYQCGKCAAGCPISYAMDYPPAQLIHAIRLGLDDLVLHSRSMWLCAACETCTTRCPQEVDIAKVMDAAKIIAVRRRIKPAVGTVRAFHRAVLANLRHFGRMWEAGMIVSLKVRTRDWFKDVALGKRMFLKGKLKPFPTFTGSHRVRKIFSRVKKLERELSRRP